MLERIKHNKLKNTGILYQILVMNMIEQALSESKSNAAYKIFKNYFKKDRALGQQLALYNLIIELKHEKKQTAQYTVKQIIKSRMRIDQVRLQREKYNCIKEIKQNYDLKNFFEARVPNYRVYASIYKIFQGLKKNNANPKIIGQAKSIILEHILHQQKHKDQLFDDEDLLLFKEQNKHMKQQILQTYVSKFNQRYSQFNNRQRYLLKLYAYSVSNSEVLNNFINQQLESFKTKPIQQNNNQQITQVISRIDEIKKIKKVQDKIYALLNLYQIANQE